MQHRQELTILALITALALFLTVAVGALLILRNPPQPAVKPTLIWANAQTVIGVDRPFLGSPSSPFTLVEFGDYQCPPCMSVNASVRQLIKQYDGRLKLAFRNLPLQMHPDALPAALGAESAGVQGKFWEMHDGLYDLAGDFNERQISALVQRLRLDRARFDRDREGVAQHTVQQDRRDAETLSVRETPTFFLCCPSGHIYRLPNLVAIEEVMRAER